MAGGIVVHIDVINGADGALGESVVVAELSLFGVRIGDIRAVFVVVGIGVTKPDQVRAGKLLVRCEILSLMFGAGGCWWSRYIPIQIYVGQVYLYRAKYIRCADESGLVCSASEIRSRDVVIFPHVVRYDR